MKNIITQMVIIAKNPPRASPTIAPVLVTVELMGATEMVVPPVLVTAELMVVTEAVVALVLGTAELMVVTEMVVAPV